MSYILDALRKADAEREIGGVPSIHAQPLGWPDEERMGQDPERVAPRRGPPWGWLVVGALLAVVAGGGATLLWRPAPTPPAGTALTPPVGTALAPSSGTASNPVPSTATASQATVPAAAPQLAAAPGASPDGAAPIALARPPSAAGASPAPRVASATPTAPPTPRADARPPAPRPSDRVDAQRPSRPAPPPKVVSATEPVFVPATGGGSGAVPSAPSTRLPNYHELPPELKQGLPALAVSGSVYSADPASRMLIINGQLMREGDAIGPGAVLEKIQPKSAVVRIRDQRAVLSW